MPKRKNRSVTEGIAHIKATFNNTLISISDNHGNVLCARSSGGSGFKGSRKGTPFGAQIASEEAARQAKEDFDMRRIEVCIRGHGAGRDSAIRGLRSVGLEITKLRDRTRLPHNGCRPRKKRRV